MIYLIINEYSESWQSNNSKDIVFATTDEQKAIEQFEYIRQNHIPTKDYTTEYYYLYSFKEEYLIKEIYWNNSTFRIMRFFDGTYEEDE